MFPIDGESGSSHLRVTLRNLCLCPIVRRQHRSRSIVRSSVWHLPPSSIVQCKMESAFPSEDLVFIVISIKGRHRIVSISLTSVI